MINMSYLWAVKLAGHEYGQDMIASMYRATDRRDRYLRTWVVTVSASGKDVGSRGKRSIDPDHHGRVTETRSKKACMRRQHVAAELCSIVSAILKTVMLWNSVGKTRPFFFI